MAKIDPFDANEKIKKACPKLEIQTTSLRFRTDYKNGHKAIEVTVFYETSPNDCSNFTSSIYDYEKDLTLEALLLQVAIDYRKCKNYYKNGKTPETTFEIE